MKVVLTNPDNLIEQAYAAKYALRDHPEFQKGDLLKIQLMSGNYYSLYWNKSSITVRDSE